MEFRKIKAGRGGFRLMCLYFTEGFYSTGKEFLAGAEGLIAGGFETM
jgi:hypothetical protein